MQQADRESAFFRGRINIVLYTEFWEPPILELPEKDVTPEAPRCARKRSSGESLRKLQAKLKRVALPNAQRADNQATKKAPKHDDVWITTVFFHIEETWCLSRMKFSKTE